MNQQDSLAQAIRSPVTSLVLIAAAAGTLMFWSGRDLSWMIAEGDSVRTKPWTLLTTVLLHADMVHLVFNLMWWWSLARHIEAAWGPGPLMGIVAFTAITSSAAEVALMHGGVGLSGVVYGLFTLCYILQRHDPRFIGVVSRQTTALMVFWFFLCIALTIAGVWNIANIAHGVGALAGWVLGKVIVAPPATPSRRTRWIALAFLLAVTSLVGAMFARPYINMATLFAPREVRAYDAIIAKRYDKAVELLEPVLKKDPSQAESWVNLGIAYLGVGRHDDAMIAYKNAIKVRPTMRPDIAPDIAKILQNKSKAAMTAGNTAEAERFAAEAKDWLTP